MAKSNFDKYVEAKLGNPEFEKRLRSAAIEWDLALQIAYRREDAGLSQKELAERVGTTQQQISRLEQPNYRGSLKTLYRVAEALGLEVRITLAAGSPGSKVAAKAVKSVGKAATSRGRVAAKPGVRARKKVAVGLRTASSGASKKSG